MFKIKKSNYKTVALILLFVVIFVAGQVAVVRSSQSKINELRSEIEKRDLRTDLKSVEELRKDYYYSETATLVSPHTMRLQMDKGEVDFVLVDVRAATDYEKGHIRGAISIPFDGSEAAIGKFKQALAEGKKDRRNYAIIYCYSSACMLGRKTGQELSKHGVSVKELGVGYNDWELQHGLWNNQGETYDINNYITRGTDVGELKPSAEFMTRPCSANDKFSC